MHGFLPLQWPDQKTFPAMMIQSHIHRIEVNPSQIGDAFRIDIVKGDAIFPHGFSILEEADVIGESRCFFHFFFQAEDGIRALVRSRGLGDVYKRQGCPPPGPARRRVRRAAWRAARRGAARAPPAGGVAAVARGRASPRRPRRNAATHPLVWAGRRRGSRPHAATAPHLWPPTGMVSSVVRR